MGKSIKLFLIDGTPAGLIAAQIGQWTGKALVSSRQDVDRLVLREETAKPCVYILAGDDPERPGVEMVYVGETENFRVRVKSHLSEKEFWNRVCVFVSTDNALTRAHIKHIEHNLIKHAKLAGRCTVDNGNEATEPYLDEADTADMQFFVSQMRLLLPVFGFRFLEVTVPVPAAMPTAVSDSVRGSSAIFEYRVKDAIARAALQDDQFVVFRGSTACFNSMVMMKTYKQRRDQLIDSGKLMKRDGLDVYEFVDDVEFNSPSAAAAVVSGGSISGRSAWKVQGSGVTYGEWEDARVGGLG